MQCSGVASGALNLINGLLGGLLPSQLTGAGTPFTITLVKDNILGPTPVLFPQPAFSNIAGITITASGSGPVSVQPLSQILKFRHHTHAQPASYSKAQEPLSSGGMIQPPCTCILTLDFPLRLQSPGLLGLNLDQVRNCHARQSVHGYLVLCRPAI